MILLLVAEAELIRELALPDSQYLVTMAGGGDYAPVLSPDGSLMLFCSTRPGGLGGEDIWASRLGPDGRWGKPYNLHDLNTPSNEGPLAITGDGLRLFVAYNTSPDPWECKLYGLRRGKGGLDIFVSQWAGRWRTPVNLEEINSPFWDGHASVTPDGRTLYFASARPGGLGGVDIWVSHFDGERWSEPENLGPPINTPGDEYCPFIAADGATLYFSSDGHGGYGGQDIFVSRFDGERWSQPENLGPQINTPGDDMFFSIPASGDYIYFSRGKLVQHIYRAPIPPKLRPKEVILVKGKALDDATGSPMPAEVVVLDLASGDTVYRTQADPRTGRFALALPEGREYAVFVEPKAPGYAYTSFHYDLRKGTRYEAEELQARLAPARPGSRFSIRNVLFDFDSHELRPESKPELEKLVKFLKEHRKLKVVIEGHTDSLGTEEYNLRLSQLRAEAVRDYLVKRGIDPKRLKVEAYGESKPIAPNDTEAGRRLNRRVEIRLE